MDSNVDITNDSSTSDKNLVNFGPVTPEFCMPVCTGWATRWALPRIFSCNSFVGGNLAIMPGHSFVSGCNEFWQLLWPPEWKK